MICSTRYRRRMRAIVSGLPPDDHWLWKALERQNAIIDNATAQGVASPGRRLATMVIKSKIGFELKHGAMDGEELHKFEKKVSEILGRAAMGLDRTFFKDFSSSLDDRQARRCIDTIRALHAVSKHWRECDTARTKSELIEFILNLPEMKGSMIAKKAFRNILSDVCWKGLN